MKDKDQTEPPSQRRFPRVKAPIFYQPAGLLGPRRRVVDIGLGGVRIYSDEALKIGQRLKLELFLPGDTSVRCLMRVVWVVELPPASPARFDVGMELLQAEESDLSRLREVLGTEADE